MLHDSIPTTARPIGDSAPLDEECVLSHALLEAIADKAPAGVGMLDRELRFVRANSKLAELTGLPPEAHIGRTPRELFPSLPLDDLEAHWRRILETGEPILGFEFCGETPAAPGGTRWWREDSYPVSFLGHIVGIGIIVVDVTEERRAAELQRLLVGIVGHDLRNPLAVITTSARMLLGREQDEGKAQCLRRIDRAARRIEALARELLDFTRVSGGEALPVCARDADLSLLVHAAAEEVRLAYPDAVIACSSGKDVRGKWDPDLVQQVVGNLLSNAVKYGTRGKEITVRCHGDGGDAVLEVHNEGRSIPPERIPHLFDGLSQFADEHSRRGGIGLGLFICREIVRAHRGEITVVSNASGTTFGVRLPKHPMAV